MSAAGGTSDFHMCSSTAVEEKVEKISSQDFYELRIPGELTVLNYYNLNLMPSLPSERAKLLGRLVNSFRKESGAIDNIVVVSGAKCPLIRFDLKYLHHLPCELSVDNRLGECKADFIRHVIEADVSGITPLYIISSLMH